MSEWQYSDRSDTVLMWANCTDTNLTAKQCFVLIIIMKRVGGLWREFVILGDHRNYCYKPQLEHTFGQHKNLFNFTKCYGSLLVFHYATVNSLWKKHKFYKHGPWFLHMKMSHFIRKRFRSKIKLVFYLKHTASQHSVGCWYQLSTVILQNILNFFVGNEFIFIVRQTKQWQK